MTAKEIFYSIPIDKIKFENRTAKREHDNEIIKTLEDNKHLIVNKKVICFPNSNWIFEQLLHERIPQFKRFYGIECNTKIYNKMKKKAERLSTKSFKLSCYKGYDIDFYKEQSKSYGYFYLDYMGFWDNKKIETIDMLGKSNVIDNKGSIISLVVSAGREHFNSLEDIKQMDTIPFLFKITAKDELFGNFPYSEYRKYGIPKKFTDIMRDNGYNSLPLLVSAYREIKTKGYQGGGHNPQLHFMFYVKKVTNGIKVLSHKKSYKYMIKVYDDMLKLDLNNKEIAVKRVRIKAHAKKMFPKKFKEDDFIKLNKGNIPFK